MSNSFFSRLKFLPLIVVVLLISGCAALPVSDEELSVLGADVHENMIRHYGEYEDTGVTTYVVGVGRRVEASSDYSGKPITFTVLDTPVVNAFSVPGGYVHVTRGLLTRVNSESELAFVIGHEIGHLTARHSAQRIGQLRTTSIFSSLLGLLVSQYSENADLGRLTSTVVDFSSALVILNYGRDAEFEADSLGLKYAFGAEYDPETAREFLDVLYKMEESRGGRSALSDLLATHPPSGERVKRAEEIASACVSGEADEEDALDTKREPYLKRIEGIVIGESLAAGTVKDGKYFNKKYLFTLEKPRGWNLATARSYLAGLYTDNDNVFLVYANASDPERPLREYAASFLRDVFEDEDMKPVFGESSFRGVPALDFYASRSRKIQAKFFMRKNINYTLIYSYAVKAFVDHGQAFRDLLAQFSFMTDDEAAGIREDRIEIYRAKGGDTFDNVSAKYYGSSEYAGRLRDFNGMTGNLAADSLLKVPPSKYLDD